VFEPLPLTLSSRVISIKCREFKLWCGYSSGMKWIMSLVFNIKVSIRVFYISWIRWVLVWRGAAIMIGIRIWIWVSYRRGAMKGMKSKTTFSPPKNTDSLLLIPLMTDTLILSEII
jgi:hypothetical protein